MTREPLERFMEKVEFADTGCWIWTAYRNAKGYGKFRVSRESGMVRAHRWAYEYWVGPIPEGLVMDHYVCSRPECVNPDHLRPVTPRENALRSDTSIPAVEASRTHCPQGHEYNEANMYPGRSFRQCRICVRKRSLDRYYAARAVRS